MLEFERKIWVDIGDDNKEIKANDNFYFVATMNPSGDYGKKELSLALWNRFTEIWVESCLDTLEPNLNKN